MNSRTWLNSLGVFDLETTGIDVFSDRIVTAYIGTMDAFGNTVQETNWLADPGIDIPEGSTEVHGVTTAFAQANGRPARDVVSEILERLRFLIQSKVVLVAYNASYDFSMLRYEALRHGLEPLPERFPIIDPLVLDKHVDKWRKGGRKLTDACAHYGVILENAHDASADAIAAGRLAQALFASPKAKEAERKGLLPESLRDVYDLQIREAAAQAASFQEYLRNGKDPEAVINGEWPLRLTPEVRTPVAA